MVGLGLDDFDGMPCCWAGAACSNACKTISLSRIPEFLISGACCAIHLSVYACIVCQTLQMHPAVVFCEGSSANRSACVLCSPQLHAARSHAADITVHSNAVPHAVALPYRAAAAAAAAAAEKSELPNVL
jgi:hypothetical protein